MNEAKEILDAIEIIVVEYLKQHSTQIYSGICQSVENEKCTVQINGKNNRVAYYGKTPSIGKSYRVFIPNGNMSNAFVIIP